MNLGTLINEESDNILTVTAILRNDNGDVITETKQVVASREEALAVVTGLQQ
jgi:hypothetical protein